jgi:hypothetical protein
MQGKNSIVNPVNLSVKISSHTYKLARTIKKKDPKDKTSNALLKRGNNVGVEAQKLIRVTD